MMDENGISPRQMRESVNKRRVHVAVRVHTRARVASGAEGRRSKIKHRAVPSLVSGRGSIYSSPYS